MVLRPSSIVVQKQFYQQMGHIFLHYFFQDWPVFFLIVCNFFFVYWSYIFSSFGAKVLWALFNYLSVKGSLWIFSVRPVSALFASLMTYKNLIYVSIAKSSSPANRRRTKKLYFCLKQSQQFCQKASLVKSRGGFAGTLHSSSPFVWKCSSRKSRT